MKIVFHSHTLSITHEQPSAIRLSRTLSATRKHCLLRRPAPSESLRQPSSSGAQKVKYSTADNTFQLFAIKNSLFTLKNGKIKTEQSVRFRCTPFFSACRMFLRLRQKVALRGTDSLTRAYLLIIRKCPSSNSYILLLSVIVCYNLQIVTFCYFSSCMRAPSCVRACALVRSMFTQTRGRPFFVASCTNIST